MALLESIRKGELARVYLLWGEDHVAMQEVVEALRDAVLRPGGRDDGTSAFNHERFEAPYLRALAPLLNACAQAPLLGAHRLVELSSPEEFGKHKRAGEGEGSGPESKKDAAIEALVEYFENPSPTTVLVVTSTGIQGTSKLVKAAKKFSGVVEHKFTAAKDADAVAEVLKSARTKKIQLDREAARALVLAVGTTRTELDPALERVAAYAGERPVTREDVEAVIVTTREANVFELTDAIGHRDHVTALRILARMVDGERDVGSVMRVLGMLVWQTRRLIVAATARDPASALGIKPFAVGKLVEQARNFDLDLLTRAHAGLARLDDDLKGGSRLTANVPYLALQRWILDTCSALPSTSPRS
jgi:DNA polymerase-3 subunit delta